MIPLWVDIPGGEYVTYGIPPTISYKVHATGVGPISLSDTSKGLAYKFWAVAFDPITKEILLIEDGVETVLYTETEDVDSMSISFTQNASVSVSTVTASKLLKLYWYDIAIPDYTVDILETLVSQAELSMDMISHPADPHSDILLAYIKEQELFVRVQREDYLVARVTVANDVKAITAIGMSETRRFQITYRGAEPTYP